MGGIHSRALSVKLHIVYRSTGSENRTSRPEFYSKLLALKSLLRSAAACASPVHFVFLNDGPVPRDRHDLMASSGEIVDRAGLGSSVGSFQETLRQVDAQGWPEDDLVYLVEDDYLHVLDALPALLDAARAIPDASYFALYIYLSIDWRRAQHFQVGDRPWLSAESTTGTFAARIGALRADRWIHRIAYRADGGWDRDACLSYGGIRPYRWSGIAAGLAGSEPGSAQTVERRLKRATAQSLLNLSAVRRAFARHLLVAPQPDLATHMTLPWLSPGVDWEAVAREVSEWTPFGGEAVEAGPSV